MKRGVVNPKPVIKKAPVLYLINYPATISFILHRRSNVSGRSLLLSHKCDRPPLVGSFSNMFLVVQCRLVVIFLLRGITDMLRYVNRWSEGQP